MTDFSRMTKAELIACLKEAEVKATSSQATCPMASTSPTALKDTEERMRAILETAVEGIITIDERGLIESLNPAAERVFGYSAHELVGQNVSVLMPPPYREGHDGYMANYLQTGHAKIIGIGREVVGRRKDGTVFPMDLAVSEVRLASRRLFTGFVRDISERRRAEIRQKVHYATVRSLAESNSLGEAAPRVMEGICQIMGWDFAEFWGVDREASVVHQVQSWHPKLEEFSESGFLSAGRSLNRGEGLPGRVWATSKPEWITSSALLAEASRLPAQLQRELHGALGLPILLGTDVLGIVIFFSREAIAPDNESLASFTAIGNQIGQFIERKRAEAKLGELARTLAEKNKELETIVYVASHDLRSPLVNIQGFSRELSRACDIVRAKLAESQSPELRTPELETLLSQDIPEAIQFILAGVKKIDTLLAGFLRFSRLGRAAIKIDRIAMASLITSIIQTMDFQIKRAGITIEVDCLPDCLGDTTQINQVFSNLLDNAIKYIDPARPGKIQVRGWTEGGRAIFAVRDNGRGIAQEHQSKIFEIFHRLDPSASEGEGLGLTIAQRILERQGGRIWVESAPQQGSTFFVSLPT